MKGKEMKNRFSDVNNEFDDIPSWAIREQEGDMDRLTERIAKLTEKSEQINRQMEETNNIIRQRTVVVQRDSAYWFVIAFVIASGIIATLIGD